MEQNLMEQVIILCPHCGEEMKYNMTYEIGDIVEGCEDTFSEAYSYICTDCQIELLIFMGVEEDQMPLVIIQDLSQAIMDMEVI